MNIVGEPILYFCVSFSFHEVHKHYFESYSLKREEAIVKLQRHWQKLLVLSDLVYYTKQPNTQI